MGGGYFFFFEASYFEIPSKKNVSHQPRPSIGYIGISHIHTEPMEKKTFASKCHFPNSV